MLLVLTSLVSQAQVNFGTPDATFTYTSVNGGTGGIVGVPIPNSGGMQVNVATGSAALPLQNIAGTQGAQQLHLGDDSSANVPLGFTFPYWGQNFTNSWMYSNGIVSFSSGNIPGAGCCSGQDLRTLTDTRYNYMIAPLWTDLIDINNNATWYKGTTNSMTYGWYNTHEYYNNNLSSFEVNINASGAFDVRFGSAFVSTGHMVTSGFTGDLSRGQYFQYYNGYGFNVPSPMSYGTSSINLCLTNPLSDPSCPGYATAYHDQQCLINPLYMSDCPGYAAANFTYQCSINPLYDVNCPGYQDAYTQQQCSINPLYSTSCSGYAQAYHDQQCSLNTLYATDCPGYAQAYFTEQCTTNPLYSSNCPGYAQAYLTQQCNANQLYSTQCPGYAQAYFNQQCQANGLYSIQCPNYATAYATQQALQQSQTTTSTTNTTTTAVVTTQSTSTPPPAGTVSATGTVSNPTQVPVISDPVVNSVITSSSTTTSPTSTTSVTSSPTSSPVTSTVVPTTTNTSSSSSSTSTSATASTTTTTDQPKSDSKSSTPPTKAQVAAAAKVASSNAESNKSMEDQVKVQGVVIGAMAYVPGFDAYKIILPDSPFYKPYSVYKNQVNVDNKRVGRALFGATDLKHNEMIQQQYK